MADTRHPLEQTVAATLRAADLAGRNALLLVGCSGGPDSTALLAALTRLADDLTLRLHAVHVDHGLRADASGDAVYVRRLGRRWDVPVSVVHVDVPARRRAHRLSIEEAARHARYAAFAAIARETAADGVLVGHTADDQTETVLLNLLRGSGLRGLGGMEAVSPLPPIPREPPPPSVPLVRPLLTVERADVAAYLRQRRLRPLQDPSNLSSSHLRNRVRRELTPLLASLRPGAADAVRRTATAAREAIDYLNAVAADAERAAVRWDEAHAAWLDTAAVASQHPVIRTLILQRAVEEATGTRAGFGARHWEAMARLLTNGRTGDRLVLPHGLELTRLAGETALSRGPIPCPLPPLAPATLEVPGTTMIGGWRFKCTTTREGTIAVHADYPGVRSNHLPRPPETILSPSIAAPQRLAVRGRRPGDRVRLRGGTRKLQDVLTDAGVPRSWRDRVPIVYDTVSGDIVWVVGVAETAVVGDQITSPAWTEAGTMKT